MLLQMALFVGFVKHALRSEEEKHIGEIQKNNEHHQGNTEKKTKIK